MTKKPEYIKSIVKYYDDFTDVKLYNRAWIPKLGSKKYHTTDDILYQPSRSALVERSKQASLARTRSTIRDLVLSNRFDYFATFTFDPKLYDSFDFSVVSHLMSNFLRSYADSYILVPELHKSGAYHFHALLTISPNHLSRFSKRVFNIHKFKHGFTTAIVLDSSNPLRLAHYITKYITKDLASSVPKGKKRFWISRHLRRPNVAYNLHSDFDLDRTPDYVFGHSLGFTIPKAQGPTDSGP